MTKIAIEASIISVQPRIRLLRSFDQRQHNYSGYALLVADLLDPGKPPVWVGVGPAAQAKFNFRAGGTLSVEVEPIANADLEAVDYYKAAKIQYKPADAEPSLPPPWTGVPPDLPTYRARGHRRLDEATYQSTCRTCIWGCRMPVEMTLDQWNPEQKSYRKETFCYGPKSCSLYRAGPVREVPGRNGSTWTEEDSVDEEATSHRGPND